MEYGRVQSALYKNELFQSKNRERGSIKDKYWMMLKHITHWDKK